MTSAQLSDARIENYLSRLAAAMARTSADDKQDIVREIRAHIVDSVAASTDRQAAVDRVLGLLGAPEQLARRYRTERQLTRASRSFSPWLLLRTCWGWAKLGVKGTLAFLVALLGYATALGLTVAVFLKPFMPSKIGMWIGPEGLVLAGVPAHPRIMHELLGKYYVPVMAVVAFAVAIGTTHALRWMIRKRLPSPHYEMTESSLSGVEAG
jgi:uncharacterized membrane protein